MLILWPLGLSQRFLLYHIDFLDEVGHNLKLICLEGSRRIKLRLLLVQQGGQRLLVVLERHVFEWQVVELR
jgi:hypothetical protein